MAEATNIEWRDSTFNPWIGCTRVSLACDDCYAARSTPARTMAVAWGSGEPRRRTGTTNWAEPLRWERQAAEFQATHGGRRRVFCASLADVFDNEVDPAWRADLFALIARTPSLDWLLLTKRIGNAARMIEEARGPDPADNAKPWPFPVSPRGPVPNVWLGATVINQAEADRDIPKLLATTAACRFLSIEPMLGEIDLGTPLNVCQYEDGGAWSRRNLRSHDTGLHWVIAGGESGPKARPAHPGWYRSLRDQCAAAGVPFLFKQWGEWTPGENVSKHHGTVEAVWWVDGRFMPGRENLASDHGHREDEPDLYRIGKKSAGRLLDGVEHNGFPGLARATGASHE